MSIQSIGSDAGNGDYSALRGTRRKPPEMTLDKLSEMKEKLQADGKDTSNLDKTIDHFDQLDRNQDGKLSFEEMRDGAEQYGIQLPKGHPSRPSVRNDQGGKKPTALTVDQFKELKEMMQSDGQDASGLDTIIENFDALDTDKDGKISFEEMQAGAKKYGIQLPGEPPEEAGADSLSE